MIACGSAKLRLESVGGTVSLQEKRQSHTEIESPTHAGETAEFMQGTQLLRNVIKLNICMIYTPNLLTSLSL